MKFICLVLLSWNVFSQSYTISGGGSIRDDEKRSSPYSILLEMQYNKMSGMIEKRNHRFLGAAKWQNQYVYASGGYRYLPFQTFYFLKEEGLFSSFQNPQTGLVPNPVSRSFWLGLFPGRISPGIFYAEKINGKKTGFYLDFYNSFSILYLPFIDSWILFSNIKKTRMELFSRKIYYNLHSEILAKKRAQSGYASTDITSVKDKSGLFIYTDGGNLQRLSDSSLENNKNYLVYAEWNYLKSSRLEVMKVYHDSRLFSVAGVRLPVVSLKKGAVSLGCRIYQYGKRENGSGLYYEIWEKNIWFSAGVEKTEKDLLVEVRGGFKPVKNWKLELDLLSRKKNSQYSISYQRDNGEFRKVSVSKNMFEFRLKLTGPVLAVILAAYKTDPEHTYQFSGNLQFLLRF